MKINERKLNALLQSGVLCSPGSSKSVQAKLKTIVVDSVSSTLFDYNDLFVMDEEDVAKDNLKKKMNRVFNKTSNSLYIPKNNKKRVK